VKLSYQLDVDAPIEKVFALVDDDQNIKRWMDGLEETIYPEGRDSAKPVGTRFKQRIREGRRVADYDGEVTAYDKPRHLGVRIGNKQFAMQVDYRFHENGTGTRLNYTTEMVQATGFARLMSALFGWFTRRILDKQMRKLKELAESDA
jgi:uncharacterized protein YndB with AHSA1/START domain